MVARTIDDAVALSRELDGWNRIVTLEGELIVPSGAMSGGARRSRTPGLLARKQEIEALTAELSGLGKESARLAKSVRKAEKRLSDLAASIADSDKSISEARTAQAEQSRQADFAAREADRLAKQLETTAVEKQEAELLCRDESDAAARLQQLLDTVGQANQDLDRKVAGAVQDVEALQRRRSEAREELMRLNVELAASNERALALRGSLAESRASLDRMTADLELRRSHVGHASTGAESLEQERETVEAERERQRELLCAAETNLNTLTIERTSEQTTAAHLDSRLKDATAERNRLLAETHEADIREARLEVQVSSAAERLLDEYGVSQERVMDWPEDIEIERGTATEVARLRREIKDMGPVNTGAAAEYERIKERWDFLTAQRADLEQARDQINAAIAEIDANTRGMFTETFNTVSANFDLIFKRLFGGGKTELSLTDPNDLLETGIDVSVQLPGKKLQDLALLSGGERALAASAFIFALLMAKPSPFVVLDEVDAPLDESNVERFVEVLREFAAESQFVVVTHNRGTMEAADTLYGVTMQEPGISKIISVRLAPEDSRASEPTLVPAGTKE